MIGECTQLTKNFSEYAEIQIGNIPSRTTVDKVQKSTIIKMENLREAGHVQRANNTRNTKKFYPRSFKNNPYLPYVTRGYKVQLEVGNLEFYLIKQRKSEEVHVHLSFYN